MPQKELEVNKKKCKHNYNIKLPHIFYEVNIIDKNKAKGDVKNYLGKGYTACTSTSKHKSTIYISLPIKQIAIPTLCHELIHVLQNICKDRDMVFENETEHCAYIFQYMLNEILGNEYQ